MRMLNGYGEALYARTTVSLSMVSMRFIHTVPEWGHLPFLMLKNITSYVQTTRDCLLYVMDAE